MCRRDKYLLYGVGLLAGAAFGLSKAVIRLDSWWNDFGPSLFVGAIMALLFGGMGLGGSVLLVAYLEVEEERQREKLETKRDREKE
jgi:hypothetical protein